MSKTNKAFDELFALFSQVPKDVQEEIKTVSIQKSYQSKETIFYKSEPLKYLYLISKGTIHIVKDDEEGKEQIVSILRKGDFFPHIGLFDKSTKTPGIAITTEDTELFLIPIDYFQNIALQYPVILMEYSKVLQKKILELQIRLEEKAFYNTYQQIIRRIIFLAKQYGITETTSESVQLTISLTHEELAHLVGTTRETVSRTITKLKKLHALEINQGKWTLHLPLLKKETNDLL